MPKLSFEVPDNKLRKMFMMARYIGCLPTLKVVVRGSELHHSVVFNRTKHQKKQRKLKGLIENFVGLTVKRLLLIALNVLEIVADAKRAGRTIVSLESKAGADITLEDMYKDRLGMPGDRPWRRGYVELKMPVLESIECSRKPIVVWGHEQGVRWKTPLRSYRQN